MSNENLFIQKCPCPQSFLQNPEPANISSFPCWMKQPDVISKSPIDVNLVARRARISDRLHVFLSDVTLHLRLPLCTVITNKANYPQVTLHGLGCHQSLHVLRRIYKMDNGHYSHTGCIFWMTPSLNYNTIIISYETKRVIQVATNNAF